MRTPGFELTGTIRIVVLDDRKRFPIESNDVLQTMLHDKDPKSGEMLSDESIVNNVSSVFHGMRGSSVLHLLSFSLC